MNSSLILAACACWLLAGCRPHTRSSASRVQAETEGRNTQGAKQDVRRYIPKGTARVEILSLAATQRVIDLQRTVVEHIREDPDWWLEHVVNSTPGEPLPYDPKIGLSEAEYREFLDAADQMSLRRTGETTLTFRAQGDSQFVLDGGEQLPELTGIRIDLDRDCVSTVYGTAAERSEIFPGLVKQKITGAWRGTEWHFAKLGQRLETGTSVSFVLGELVGKRRVLLYFRVTHFASGKPKRVTRLVTYDLPTRE